MIKSLSAGTSENVDINMYYCGTQNCEPNHDYGPALRDHYLIHYISGGEGVFSADGNTYKLVEGQGFLIYPNVISYYKADGQNPWTYSWVAFNGLKAGHYLKQTGLSRENPVFTYNNDSYLKDCIDEMIECRNIISGRDLRLTGLLYMFLSKLIETNGTGSQDYYTTERSNHYIDLAVRYIHMNYSRSITISEIASSIGLDRSYLSSLFKKKLNVSPQEYLLNLRIEKSCVLMGNESLTIGNISRSVGYNDPLHFSKIFRKIKNVSPSKYRENLLKNKHRGCR